MSHTLGQTTQEEEVSYLKIYPEQVKELSNQKSSESMYCRTVTQTAQWTHPCNVDQKKLRTLESRIQRINMLDTEHQII